VQLLSQLPDDVRGSAALLISELATNALLYGEGEFAVSVSYLPDDRAARVEVRDAGPGQPAIQNPDNSAEHGRGLRLVQALATRWGVQRSQVDRRKTVWFEVAVHN
jgi:anti-sigma regulatory factor (Ser/Thr protein kinase)